MNTCTLCHKHLATELDVYGWPTYPLCLHCWFRIGQKYPRFKRKDALLYNYYQGPRFSLDIAPDRVILRQIVQYPANIADGNPPRSWWERENLMDLFVRTKQTPAMGPSSAEQSATVTLRLTPSQLADLISRLEGEADRLGAYRGGAPDWVECDLGLQNVVVMPQ